MAHVLVGFAGPIVVAPRFFGIEDENELVAYLHTWRVLGHLLGIDDQYNPFVGDLLAIQVSIDESSLILLLIDDDNEAVLFCGRSWRCESSRKFLPSY